jgi:hypothetical protein
MPNRNQTNPWATKPAIGNTAPSGQAYPLYLGRPSEEEGRLDLDVNSPLSEEEGENDEDDLKTIKDYIKIKKEKSSTKTNEAMDLSDSPKLQSDITLFL